MEHSPLAKLPAEIRNQIYHLVLTQPGPIFLDCTPDCRRVWSADSRRGKLLALTRTCHTVRKESIKIFYATNTFEHRARTYQFPFPSPIQAFDTQLGRELAAVIRKVVVVLPDIQALTPYNVWIGEENVVPTANQLIDLASKNDTRACQLRCTVHFHDQFTTVYKRSLWQLDFELSDMRNCEVGFDEFKAAIRQKSEETNDLDVQKHLSKMGEKVTKWQAMTGGTTTSRLKMMSEKPMWRRRAMEE